MKNKGQNKAVLLDKEWHAAIYAQRKSKYSRAMAPCNRHEAVGVAPPRHEFAGLGVEIINF